MYHYLIDLDQKFHIPTPDLNFDTDQSNCKGQGIFKETSKVSQITRLRATVFVK